MFDPTPAAEVLLAARHPGEQLSTIPLSIAPSTPTDLQINVDNVLDEVTLSWGGSSDFDFDYYAIYKSLDDEFSSNEILTQITETTYNDLSVDGEYYYRVSAFDLNGNESELSASVQVTTELLSNDLLDIPTEFALNGCYPNPFNPSTTVEYAIPEISNVKISILDITGREVDILINGIQTPGFHQIKWDAQNLPAGIYMVMMRTDDFTQVQKIMLLK